MNELEIEPERAADLYHALVCLIRVVLERLPMTHE